MDKNNKMVDHIFKYICKTVKGLVAKLTPPHVQSTWAFRGERVRVMRVVAYCNYLSKNTYVKLIYIYIYSYVPCSLLFK